MIEEVTVPEHTTFKLTLESGWTFWKVRTGCVRVQKGDFTAYLLEEDVVPLAKFLVLTAELPSDTV